LWPAAGTEEATESGAEGQHLEMAGEGKEVRRETGGGDRTLP
jgi:hypothetical protein